MNILLTGVTGFVGKRLAERIASQEAIFLTCAIREEIPDCPGRQVVIGDIGAKTNWKEAVDSQDVVIHSAARVHVMRDHSKDPLTEYRKVNVEGTLNFARQCVASGVKRFVFISSIKVNGEVTPVGGRFTPEDIPAPQDAYGVSKLEAEKELTRLSRETGMEVVIIRPPLVYGPEVKGNFSTMKRLLQKGVPLPLGSVDNKRTLVALDNLVDLILTCVEHPSAANEIFLVGDGQDVSTTELLQEIGLAIGKRARLIPIPASVLMFGAALIGKRDIGERVLGSLRIDISKTRHLLNWEPTLSFKEGIRRCFYSEDSN